MFTRVYKGYVLAALTSVTTLNFLDRNLIILLIQPIKDDLHLSDSQLGFLTGIAFGLFYATLGLPVARWADRGNRVTITSIAIGLWGITVMSCLFVRSFAQLACARVAAATGEAGCLPPTYSLVGNYYPGGGERSRAMAIYWLANPLASLLGFLAGGWLNTLYGWRMTFFLMGFPALIVAALFKFTVSEPRRLNSEVPNNPSPTFVNMLTLLWRLRSVRHLSTALILLFTMSLGLAPWYAAFLIRSHGMKVAEVGISLGLSFGLCGIVGTLTGGYVASTWLSSDERGQMRVTAVVVAILLPCLCLFLLIPERQLALLSLIPLVLVFNFFFGPAFALLQRLVPDEARATAMSVVMLLANLIGMGLGPQIVGVLSDLLRPSYGLDSLRYAMLCLSLIALWSAYHFWKCGSTICEDLVYGSRTGLTVAEVVVRQQEAT